MMDNMMDIKTRLNNNEVVPMIDVIRCGEDFDIKKSLNNKLNVGRLMEDAAAVDGLPGFFVITDDADVQHVIDTNTGRYWKCSNLTVGDELGLDSTKDNLYKYLNLNIDYGKSHGTPDGVCKVYTADLHGIVLLLRDRYTFKQKVLETKFEKQIVANHMNGCRLENTFDNLEWCTQGENNAHGNVAQSIRVHFPQLSENVMREADGRLTYKLKFTLSYEYINEYDDLVNDIKWHGGFNSYGETYNGWFDFENDRCATYEDTRNFIEYLWKSKYIDDETYNLAMNG